MQFGTLPAYLKDQPVALANGHSASDAQNGTLRSTNEEYGVLPKMDGGYSPMPAGPATRQYTPDERKAKRAKRKQEALGGDRGRQNQPITHEQDVFDEVPIHPAPGARGTKAREVIYDRVIGAPPTEVADVDTSSGDSPKSAAGRSHYESVFSKLD